MMRHEMQDLRKLLDEHAEIFRIPKLTDGALQAYWNALSDVPFPAVQGCAANHLRKGRFFPKPAELRPKDWATTPKPFVRQEFDSDLERLAGVPARQALGDRELRAKLDARLAYLTSGPNETAASRDSFAAASWRSVETWLEWRLEEKHADGRWLGPDGHWARP